MADKTLAERVDSIERVFWVAAVLAVILGIPVGWGYYVMREGYGIAERKAEIAKAGNDEIKKMGDAVSSMVEQEIKSRLTGRVLVSYEENRIIEMGTRNIVTIKAKPGDTIVANYSASAESSKFYYSIVGVGEGAKPMTRSSQIIDQITKTNPNGLGWQSLSATQAFKVEGNEVSIGVEFKTGDLTGTAVKVFGSTLVVTVVPQFGDPSAK